MKNLFLGVVATTMLILPSLSASAAESNTYIGVIAGQANVDISNSGADRINDTDTSLKLFAGADMNRDLSLEFGYINFGNYSAHYPLYNETDNFKGNAFFATAIGKLPVASNFGLYAKVGLNYWRAKATGNATVGGVPVSGSGDGTGVSPVFGVGLNLNVTDRLTLRAEWEQYSDVADGVNVTFPGYGTVALSGSDVDVMGVGLQYHF